VACRAALAERRIKGAALDVFEVEPLPEDSPLWGLDNVLLSPHCADRTSMFQFDSLRMFVDNMHSYLADGRLANVVDKTQGY
jgi:phosphoglycerate dehydrogenase-like enzyme